MCCCSLIVLCQNSLIVLILERAKSQSPKSPQSVFPIIPLVEAFAIFPYSPRSCGSDTCYDRSNINLERGCGVLKTRRENRL